jgi:hypothetical protein
MVYTFARISAVVAMRVEDYFPHGKRWWVRLQEKGGKRHEMPAHHKLEQFPPALLPTASPPRSASWRRRPAQRAIHPERTLQQDSVLGRKSKNARGPNSLPIVNPIEMGQSSMYAAVIGDALRSRTEGRQTTEVAIAVASLKPA